MAKETRPDVLDFKNIVGWKSEPKTFMVTAKEGIIFALSVGFNKDPMNEDELRFTYERHPEFTIFPTLCFSIARMIPQEYFMKCPFMPKSYNPNNLLHASHYVEFLKKIQIDQEYITDYEITDAVDKGKVAFIGFQATTYHSKTKELCFKHKTSLAIKGISGFGYKGNGNLLKVPKIPERSPDSILPFSTYGSQALLYRLLSDPNPIHASIQIAKQNKFQRPILHGLCSLSVISKEIVMGLLNGKEDRLKSMQCSFVGVVYPGEEITLKAWKQGNNLIFFEAFSVARKSPTVVGSLETHPSSSL